MGRDVACKYISTFNCYCFWLCSLAQAACDATTRFQCVAVGYPGHTADATIFRKIFVPALDERIPDGYCAVYDGGFPASAKIITPFKELVAGKYKKARAMALPNHLRALVNKGISGARVRIEHGFCRVSLCWPLVGGTMTIGAGSFETVVEVITVAYVLHNLLVEEITESEWEKFQEENADDWNKIRELHRAMADPDYFEDPDLEEDAEEDAAAEEAAASAGCCAAAAQNASGCTGTAAAPPLPRSLLPLQPMSSMELYEKSNDKLRLRLAETARRALVPHFSSWRGDKLAYEHAAQRARAVAYHSDRHANMRQALQLAGGR